MKYLSPRADSFVRELIEKESFTFKYIVYLEKNYRHFAYRFDSEYPHTPVNTKQASNDRSRIYSSAKMADNLFFFAPSSLCI